MGAPVDRLLSRLYEIPGSPSWPSGGFHVLNGACQWLQTPFVVERYTAAGLLAGVMTGGVPAQTSAVVRVVATNGNQTWTVQASTVQPGAGGETETQVSAISNQLQASAISVQYSIRSTAAFTFAGTLQMDLRAIGQLEDPPPASDEVWWFVPRNLADRALYIEQPTPRQVRRWSLWPGTGFPSWR